MAGAWRACVSAGLNTRAFFGYTVRQNRVRATGAKAMSTVEEKPALICERCDRESAHLTELRDADDRIHRVCWSCLYRTEKRINVNRRWQRARRN